MANKPSERTNRTKPDDTLNLTPMIDMITCLMFFLMMFAGMLPVVIIDAPLPKIASTADEVRKAKESENKLEIMLYITANGLNVKSDIGSQSFGLNGKGKYDYEGLHKFLVTLHSKRPTTREITLMPSDDTPYEVMIEVMDAARELKKEDTGYKPIPAEITHHAERLKFNQLFPDVSIGGV